MSKPKALFIMSDYGHDPTETAIPYAAFKRAGWEVSFATENGQSPECDKKMLEGWTGKLLGAPAPAKEAYATMRSESSIQHPLAWTAPDFSVSSFDLLFFPGGHDKGVRQALDSTEVRRHLADFWPGVRRKTSSGDGAKVVGAVCHGVLVVSETTDASGNSILHDATTTTLPNSFESGIWWATRPFLGDYYKTYGKGSDNCEEMVRKRLSNPASQFKGCSTPGPFVVEDPTYNYISARYPGDAQVLAEKIVALVERVRVKS